MILSHRRREALAKVPSREPKAPIAEKPVAADPKAAGRTVETRDDARQSRRR